MTSQEKSPEKDQQPTVAMEAEVEGGVDRSPHVVMLSSPGMGHLIPLAEFARCLAVHHGFSVTLVATADFASSSGYRAFVDSLPPGVASVTLPPVDVPDGMGITATISLAIVESLPALRRIVSGLKRTVRLVAFVADLFGTDTFDLASEFDIPPFIFFASNLFLLSLSLHLPALHETMPRLPDPVTLPGCLPMHWADLPIVVKDWRTEEFTWLLHHLKRYEKAEGILVNSFQEMEPETAAVLKEKNPGQPPIHLIGEEGVVRREEISAAVAELMEGEEGRAARERVKQLQVAATAAAAVGGASHQALAEVVAKWEDSS
ncbi:hypothetical protein OPV22_008435 [Ensete ventricosum]|uniref:Glycosyltransferase n=1 Tax=Ensete ventricosum TaxID=4639 RepID=A0AAV8RDH8_ENSVE|nr:hypothetical protein OPV22_008435 [Ensete ventricosum]